eukprot:TRINITY_DN67333_c7_g2_i4.p1 TRINITY_DN67333_c7_g2~~TRINITY_DN67333_c7_g2_i4.p1  ORF type:complete len:418 (-),score=202.19 TRINITY_DN67333_c7_g2_i4:1103-2356(-)
MRVVIYGNQQQQQQQHQRETNVNGGSEGIRSAAAALLATVTHRSMRYFWYTIGLHVVMTWWMPFESFLLLQSMSAGFALVVVLITLASDAYDEPDDFVDVVESVSVVPLPRPAAPKNRREEEEEEEQQLQQPVLKAVVHPPVRRERKEEAEPLAQAATSFEKPPQTTDKKRKKNKNNNDTQLERSYRAVDEARRYLDNNNNNNSNSSSSNNNNNNNSSSSSSNNNDNNNNNFNNNNVKKRSNTAADDETEQEPRKRRGSKLGGKLKKAFSRFKLSNKNKKKPKEQQLSSQCVWVQYLGQKSLVVLLAVRNVTDMKRVIQKEFGRSLGKYKLRQISLFNSRTGLLVRSSEPIRQVLAGVSHKYPLLVEGGAQAPGKSSGEVIIGEMLPYMPSWFRRQHLQRSIQRRSVSTMRLNSKKH